MISPEETRLCWIGGTMVEDWYVETYRVGTYSEEQYLNIEFVTDKNIDVLSVTDVQVQLNRRETECYTIEVADVKRISQLGDGRVYYEVCALIEDQRPVIGVPGTKSECDSGAHESKPLSEYLNNG